MIPVYPANEPIKLDPKYVPRDELDARAIGDLLDATQEANMREFFK